MKANFKMNDEFRLKTDKNFTSQFPSGGYNPDGSVRNRNDKVNKRVGSVATVYEIHDQPATSRAKVRYSLDFGDLKVRLNEQELLEVFEAVEQ